VVPLNMGPPRSLTRFFVAICTLAAAAPTLAQPTDTAVKAAFLPRFARYVTWPAAAMPQANDPFVLCVIGADPFGIILDDAARSQQVDGRRIIVRRTGVANVNGCHIAFVTDGHGQSASRVIAAIDGKPVLTVTDGAGIGQRGIIHFTVVGGRVRFFIDQSGATRRGLNVSSRLLALAVGVRQ